MFRRKWKTTTGLHFVIQLVGESESDDAMRSDDLAAMKIMSLFPARVVAVMNCYLSFPKARLF